ncbi:hypothetical protein L208DRAFT_1381998 [Tricholoma matsutake]|nr:hypothetical protein L208DRAFT_1381998 [Tricholoma matsutake 945]
MPSSVRGLVAHGVTTGQRMLIDFCGPNLVRFRSRVPSRSFKFPLPLEQRWYLVNEIRRRLTPTQRRKDTSECWTDDDLWGLTTGCPESAWTPRTFTLSICSRQTFSTTNTLQRNKEHIVYDVFMKRDRYPYVSPVPKLLIREIWGMVGALVYVW